MFQELKVCCDCNESKDVSQYYWNKKLQRHSSYCKECHIKRCSGRILTAQNKVNEKKSIKKYSQTEKGRSKINEATKRARAKFPEKWDARNKLRYAVKMGEVTKPIHCEKCDEIKALHGHHEDYVKPLEVMWLCTRCHADRHKYLKELTLSQ